MTHVLSGVALAGALPAGMKPARGAAALLAAAVLLPESDIVLRVAGMDEWVFGYGGLTHSLPGVAVLSIVTAFVARPFLPGWNFPLLAAFSLAGGLLNILFDCLTAWGPAPFAPFSPLRVSLDLAAGTDPVLLAILLGGVAWGIADPAKELRAGRTALILSGAWFLALAGSHTMGREQARAGFAQVGIVAERLEAYPVSFSPLGWRGVAWTRDRYFTAEVGTFTGVRGRVRSYFRHPLPAGLEGDFSRAFMAWARAPLVRFIAGRYPNEAVVVDLRFATPDRAVMGAVISRGTDGPAHRWLDPDEPMQAPDMEFELPQGRGR